MRILTALTLVDLLVAVVVVLCAARSLRRGRGVLGAVESAAAALVLSWLVAVAVVTWGPTPLARATARSELVETVPVPHRAINQTTDLLGPGPVAR